MAGNNKALLIGGAAVLGVGALAYAASKAGSSSTRGTTVSFAQANPQSVAAVENAQVAEANTLAAATSDRIKSVASLVLGLQGLQTQVTLGQLDVQKTALETAAATEQVGLQTSAQQQETYNNDQALIEKATLDDAAAQAVAKTVSDANTKIATVYGQTQTSVAQSAASASEYNASEAAGASETASHAAQQNGLWSTIGGIAASVLHFFSPAFGGYPTDPTQSAFAAADAVDSSAINNIIVPNLPLIGTPA